MLAVFGEPSARWRANWSGARNAAIIATTEAVLKETSDLRELSILKDVKSGAQSRTEIERMIVKNLDEESTPGGDACDRSRTKERLDLHRGFRVSTRS